MVTLSHWHWNYFDYMVRKRQTTPEKLYKLISDLYPEAKKLWAPIYIFIERVSTREIAKDRNLANDNDAYAPNALVLRTPTPEEMLRDRLSPPQPPVLPIVKWSPFKPIARARRYFPESSC